MMKKNVFAGKLRSVTALLLAVMFAFALVVPTSYAADTGNTGIAGLDYDTREIIVNSSSDGIFINLTAETFTLGRSDYAIEGYSVDGGATWKAGGADVLTAAKVPGLFAKKDLKLQLTDSLDRKTKAPTDTARVVIFPKINKRPAAPKVTINYEIGNDPSGATPNEWVLVSKEKGADKTIPLSQGLEVAVGASKKTSNLTYGTIKLDHGIPFAAQTKSSPKYLVRYAASANGVDFTAASLPTSVSVKSEKKASKTKANYKNEVIKVPFGYMVFAGDEAALATANYDLAFQYANSGEDSLSRGGLFRVISKKGTKFSLSNYLSEQPETLIIWKLPTATAPATAKQVYQLAPRARVESKVTYGTNGKVKLEKKYEVKNLKDKWSTLPAVRESVSLDVRIKPAAKANGKVDTGYARSSIGDVKVDYGVYDESKNKEGIIQAKITPRTSNAITNVTVDKAANIVTANITTDTICSVDVSVLEDVTESESDWTSGAKLGGGTTPVSAIIENEEVNVSVSPTLPTHFVIVVKLIAENGDSLVEPFVFIGETVAHEIFDELAPANFEPETVITLGGAPDSQDANENFLVTLEGVEKIVMGENGFNILSEVNGNKYHFTNVDDKLLSRAVDDKIVATREDGSETYMIKIAKISKDSAKKEVVIASTDDPAMTEFFGFVKIDMEEADAANGVAVPELDMSDADSGVTLTPPAPGPLSRGLTRDIGLGTIGVNGEGFVEVGFKLEKTMGDVNINANVSGKLSVTANVELMPYIISQWKKASWWPHVPYLDISMEYYFHAMAVVSFERSVDASITYSKEGKANLAPQAFKLGTLDVPFYGGLIGLRATLSIPVEWNINASATFHNYALVKVGFEYTRQRNGSSTLREINEKINESDANISGEVNFKIGLRAEFGVYILWGAVEAAAGVQAGGELNIKISLLDYTNHNEKMHACLGCGEASISAFMDITLRVSFDVIIKKGDIINKTIPVFKIPLKTWFVSIYSAPESKRANPDPGTIKSTWANNEFVYGGKFTYGEGNCTNYRYRTTINPIYTADSKRIPAVYWEIANSDGKIVESGFGQQAIYLYPGNYTLNADLDKLAFQPVTFEVKDKAQYVDVTGDENYVTAVVISDTNAVVAQGNTKQLSAYAERKNAVPTSKDILWISSDPNVATVDSSGLVTAISAGIAIITAQHSEYNAKTAECEVLVPGIARIDGPTEMMESYGDGEAANTLTLSAVAFPQPNPAILWSSSDASIASVDTNGVVTAKNAGSATITATANTANGTFTKDVVVTITSNTELIHVKQQNYSTVNWGQAGKTYVLDSDITLTEDWSPIGTFSGTFDGRGHVIRGLRMNLRGGNAGFFAETNNATIKNLGIVVGTVYTAANGDAGAFIGQAWGTITISNCYAAGTSVKITGTSGKSVGGLVGYAGGKISISNSYSVIDTIRQDFDGNAHAGGLIGDAGSNPVTLTNCYVSSAVSTKKTSKSNSIAGRLIGSGSYEATGGFLGRGETYNWKGTTTEATTCYHNKDIYLRNGTECFRENPYFGNGKNSSQLKQQATFAGWDFNSTWQIVGNNYPTLKVFNG